MVLRGRRKGFCTLPKSEPNVRVLWHFQKRWQGVGRLNRIWTDAFRVAGAVQETCASEMLGGQGADFLRKVAFWSIRSSGLLSSFCVAGAALDTDGVEKSQSALARGRQLCTQFSIFEGSLAELL